MCPLTPVGWTVGPSAEPGNERREGGRTTHWIWRGVVESIAGPGPTQGLPHRETVDTVPLRGTLHPRPRGPPLRCVIRVPGRREELRDRGPSLAGIDLLLVPTGPLHAPSPKASVCVTPVADDEIHHSAPTRVPTVPPPPGPDGRPDGESLDPSVTVETERDSEVGFLHLVLSCPLRDPRSPSQESSSGPLHQFPPSRNPSLLLGRAPGPPLHWGRTSVSQDTDPDSVGHDAHLLHLSRTRMSTDPHWVRLGVGPCPGHQTWHPRVGPGHPSTGSPDRPRVDTEEERTTQCPTSSGRTTVRRS